MFDTGKMPKKKGMKGKNGNPEAVSAPETPNSSLFSEMPKRGIPVPRESERELEFPADWDTAESAARISLRQLKCRFCPSILPRFRGRRCLPVFQLTDRNFTMTGYTVHTGASKEYSDNFANVFGDGRQKKKKTGKKKAARAAAKNTAKKKARKKKKS